MLSEDIFHLEENLKCDVGSDTSVKELSLLEPSYCARQLEINLKHIKQNVSNYLQFLCTVTSMHYRAARARLVRLDNTRNGGAPPPPLLSARLIICTESFGKIPVWGENPKSVPASLIVYIIVQ
jgi:hypothetical protein